MMFITFRQNGDISNCLPDFYQDCFDALYNKHDRVHKVGFKRTFHCNISKREFQTVFSYFCSHTWRQEIYDFSEDKILNWLEKSLKKQNLSVSAESYLKDLTDSLCIITCEGHRYRFAHRSFQTYFAAKYTCSLSDEQQKEFFMDKFYYKSYFDENYLNILCQLNPERFLYNLVQSIFQKIMPTCNNKRIFCANLFPEFKISDDEIYPSVNSSYPIIAYCLSLIYPNFSIFYQNSSFGDFELDFQHNKCYAIAQKLHKSHLGIICNQVVDAPNTFIIQLKELLTSDAVSENDKSRIFKYIFRTYAVSETYQVITDWLAEREAARQKPSSDDKFADY